MIPTPIIVSWSGGKDCALALERILESSAYEVVSLLTTVNPEFDRVVMHGVRRELIEAQAEALQLPLYIISLPASPSNDAYDNAMRDAMAHFHAQGVRHVMFGDIFLEDVRAYREPRLQQAGMQGVFPLWGEPSEKLAQEFINRGYSAIAACVDTQQLDGTFCGRVLDDAFFSDLPAGVDPCGENGEFHTLLTNAPHFSAPLHVQIGERVLRHDRFLYCDLSLQNA